MWAKLAQTDVVVRAGAVVRAHGDEDVEGAIRREEVNGDGHSPSVCSCAPLVVLPPPPA